MYLANLDSGTDRVTSQNIERIDYYWDHEKADTKCFHFTYIPLNRVIIFSETVMLR